MTWTAVCGYDRLLPGRGVCALVGGEQVAVFRLASGEVLAIGNRDPFSGAYVLSRGIVGSRGDEPFVAAPVYKQAISLRTGRALDEPATAVPTYRVRISDGAVEVAAARPAESRSASEVEYQAQSDIDVGHERRGHLASEVGEVGPVEGYQRRHVGHRVAR